MNGEVIGEFLKSTHEKYRDKLKDDFKKMKGFFTDEPQVSRKGIPYDNSVCESFFANMKREELYRRNYQTETEFLNGVHNYIAFYNSERLSSKVFILSAYG